MRVDVAALVLLAVLLSIVITCCGGVYGEEERRSERKKTASCGAQDEMQVDPFTVGNGGSLLVSAFSANGHAHEGAAVKGTRRTPLKNYAQSRPFTYSSIIGAQMIDAKNASMYPSELYEEMEAYIANERANGKMSEEYAIFDFLSLKATDSFTHSVMSANVLAEEVMKLSLGIPLVWREAKDTYIISTAINMADIVMVKTGVRESDGAHMFAMIDAGVDAMAAMCGVEMLVTPRLAPFLRNKPLWPGFALWYKFLNGLPFDTKVVTESVILSHHHKDHVQGYDPLVSSSYTFSVDNSVVACDILDTDSETGQPVAPEIYWSANTMNAIKRDNRASRYYMWGNAAQFGNNLPSSLSIFNFVRYPEFSAAINRATVGVDFLVDGYKASMNVAEHELTEEDRENILAMFNMIRESQHESGLATVNPDTTDLFDAQLDRHFNRRGKSTLTLDSVLRTHPISGNPLTLREDVIFMKQFIESYSYAAQGFVHAPHIVPVNGTRDAPYVLETRGGDMSFEMWNVDGEGSGSDLYIKWYDRALEPLVPKDWSQLPHVINMQPRDLIEPAEIISIFHLGDNFFPQYPNFESMRSPPRNAFDWVDGLIDAAKMADNSSLILSGHASGATKIYRLLEERQNEGTLDNGGMSPAPRSDRMFLYDFAHALKWVELCAVHHVNEGTPKNVAIKSCGESAPTHYTLFQGYGSISSHVDTIYKLLVGGWHFDALRTLVREPSDEAISLLVERLGTSEVMDMAQGLARRAKCGDPSLYTLALELVRFVETTTAARDGSSSSSSDDVMSQVGGDVIVFKLELLAALYALETNTTFAAMLLVEIQKIANELASKDGYEKYAIDDDYDENTHPITLKHYLVNTAQRIDPAQ